MYILAGNRIGGKERKIGGKDISLLVHGSHLKQKKFVGTKSLGITPS